MRPIAFVGIVVGGVLYMSGPLVAQIGASSSGNALSNPQVHVIAAADPVDRDRLHLRSPGHYVYEPSDRADYWSPHVRVFPDYSALRRPRNVNRLPYRRLGGAWPTTGGWSTPPVSPFACGRGFGYGNGYYWGDAADAYNQGRHDANQEYIWAIASQRAGRLINQSAEFFDEGILLFRDGHYDQAAIKWLGAADVNQANAATRLHAGHAMFALGRYADGVEFLARAYELSPTIAYKTFDLREEYGDRADYDRHLAALKTYVVNHPDDAAGLTMLGYVQFRTEGPAAALPYLDRAARLDPAGFFAEKLFDLARRSSPTEHAAPISSPPPAPGVEKNPARGSRTPAPTQTPKGYEGQLRLVRR